MNTSAVIVTHNNAGPLSRLVDDILAEGVQAVNIFENDSDSRKSLHFPGAVHHHVNQQGIGFAAAAAKGLTMAVERGDRYVLLMCDDVALDGGSLQGMIATMGDEAIAAVCPHIRDEQGQTWSFGGVVSRWTGHATGRKRFCARQEDVDFAPGCCVLFRVEALMEVGVVDPQWAFYFEDADLCFRLKRAGWRIVATRAGRATHQTKGAMARNDAVRCRYAARNGLWFSELHLTRLTQLFQLGVTIPAKIIVSLLRLRFAAATGFLRGTLDWLARCRGLL